MQIKTATVILTHAQILALPTTPINIVKAPINSYIVPLSSLWEYDFSNGDYTNIVEPSFVGLGSDGSADGSINFSNFSARSLNSFKRLFAPASQFFPTKGITTLTGGMSSDVNGQVTGTFALCDVNLAVFNFSDWLGATWRVEAGNGAGNLTGGNSSNKMAVTLMYLVIPENL